MSKHSPARAVATLRCLFSGFVHRRVHNHFGSCCWCHEHHIGHFIGAPFARGCFRLKLAEVHGLEWLRGTCPQVFLQMIVLAATHREAELVDRLGRLALTLTELSHMCMNLVLVDADTSHFCVAYQRWQ
eukprot:3788763-Amphidinium_carterae.1